MESRGLTIKFEDSVTGEEPVDLPLCKKYLAIDFDDHNELLSVLITEAREEVEKYCGITLFEKNITARWEYLTSAELPYGPIKSITSIQDKDDVSLNTDSYTIEGLYGSFMSLTDTSLSPVVARYLAGYDKCPFPLKLAIMKLVADQFEFRVSVTLTNMSTALPNDWKASASKYSRKTWMS